MWKYRVERLNKEHRLYCMHKNDRKVHITCQDLIAVARFDEKSDHGPEVKIPEKYGNTGKTRPYF